MVEGAPAPHTLLVEMQRESNSSGASFTQAPTPFPRNTYNRVHLQARGLDLHHILVFVNLDAHSARVDRGALRSLQNTQALTQDKKGEAGGRGDKQHNKFQ
jgi:hypothetical protein